MTVSDGPSPTRNEPEEWKLSKREMRTKKDEAVCMGEGPHLARLQPGSIQEKIKLHMKSLRLVFFPAVFDHYSAGPLAE